MLDVGICNQEKKERKTKGKKERKIKEKKRKKDKRKKRKDGNQPQNVISF